VALGQGAHAVLAGDILGASTSHGRLDVEVAADGLQASRIQEARQAELTHLLGLAVAVDADPEDLAVGPDLDVGHILGNRNPQGLTRTGDDLLGLAIILESTVAGVGRTAIRQGHPEETLALNGHVVGVAGLLQRSLGELTLRGGSPHAHTDLRPRGGLGPGILHRRVEQVLEVDAGLLEARRLVVGEVVGDVVHVELLGHHSRGRSVEGAHHGGLFPPTFFDSELSSGPDRGHSRSSAGAGREPGGPSGWPRSSA